MKVYEGTLIVAGSTNEGFDIRVDLENVMKGIRVWGESVNRLEELTLVVPDGAEFPTGLLIPFRLEVG